ncbi:hypothetical protein BX600DRAFT_462094 [Xylariales sp. PMI_506]|nr:hypothetical protein BX600DRAFT_462094 [Xylariales sp. PMI_506]
MTSTAPSEYDEYPQYCYHLSPTVTKWCPLQASDIVKLKWNWGFQGQNDIFFHLNHPIRWIRIVGVVVAIDYYYGRWIYTVDDSSGCCIECVSEAPAPANPRNSAAPDNGQKELLDALPVSPHPEVDIGVVIEVKGSLKLYRDQKQVKIEKIQCIRSTNVEVQFWNKIKAFKSDVLSQPWVLERKVVRKLEKENKRDVGSKEEEASARRKHHSKSDSASARSKAYGKARPPSGSAAGMSGPKNLYKPSKLSTVSTSGDMQYDALGL